MSSRDLSEQEKAAIRSGRRELVRYHVHSIDKDDRRNTYTQFSRFQKPTAFLIHELHVEVLSLDHHDNVAVRGLGTLFVDREGRLFKGVAKS
jgi:hypothetical protein